MMIRPQAKIDTHTKTRKTFCTGPPSTSRTMDATGAVLAYAALLVAYASAAHDADDLGGHRGVVQPGSEPGRGDDQRRLEGQHDERLQGRAGRRVGLADQRLE